MKREIVNIDEELCNGCGECVPGCHEGALQIIDGKARLISDLMCDGLGACLGHCPEGAISIEKREAEPYDEMKVMKLMAHKGKNTIIAHMKHLKDHNEHGFLDDAIMYLKDNSDDMDLDVHDIIREIENHGQHAAAGGSHTGQGNKHSGCGANHSGHAVKHAAAGGNGGSCPGSQSVSFKGIAAGDLAPASETMPSALSHWPVQMHLINPAASHYSGSDMVLAADCVAYALPGFHQDHLRGKTLAIACPKLDQGTDIYIDKIRRLIDEAEINTLQLMIMQVPCCSGLLHMIRAAQALAKRKIPVKQTVVDTRGGILKDEWI